MSHVYKTVNPEAIAWCIDPDCKFIAPVNEFGCEGEILVCPKCGSKDLEIEP